MEQEKTETTEKVAIVPALFSRSPLFPPFVAIEVHVIISGAILE